METECMEYPGHRRAGLIGRGSFGEAYLFFDQVHDDMTVVKFLRSCEIDDRLEEYILREIRNHQLLSGHPAIVQLKEVYLTKGCLAVAMEFAGGGTLHDRIQKAGRFSEDVARYFFQQLIQALAWCHSKGVVHRDLKLQHLLLDKAVPDEALWDLDKLLERRPHIKLCDFGMSKSAELDSRPDTVVGTPAFTAPELFVAGPRGRHYSGEAVDVWACGVTLYFMLVGDLPFKDPHHDRVAPQLVFRGSYTIPDGVEVSPVCQDLLSRILVPDPKQRITLAAIQRHPWFCKNLPRRPGARGRGGGRRRAGWLCFCQGTDTDSDECSPGPGPEIRPSSLRQSEGEIHALIRQARDSCKSSSRLVPAAEPAGPPQDADVEATALASGFASLIHAAGGMGAGAEQ